MGLVTFLFVATYGTAREATTSDAVQQVHAGQMGPDASPTYQPKNVKLLKRPLDLVSLNHVSCVKKKTLAS